MKEVKKGEEVGAEEAEEEEEEEEKKTKERSLHLHSSGHIT